MKYQVIQRDCCRICGLENVVQNILIVSFFLFFITTPSFGQYSTIAKQMGSTQHDEADDVYADDSGNVYIFGSHNDSVVLASKTIKNFGGVDNYLIKYDCKGNVVWAQTIGSSGNEYVYFLGMDNDIYGNIYITGGYAGTATLTSQNGSNKTLTSQGGLDIYVAKYAPSGNILWANSYGGSSDDIGHDIAVDKNLKYYITGEFFGNTKFGSITYTSGGTSDAFIIKSDSTGNAIWGVQGNGTGDDVGISVHIDKSDNIVICGLCGLSGQTITFGSKTSQSSNFHTGYLARFNTSGTCLWLQSMYTSTGGNVWLELVIDINNNIYVSGHNKGSSIVTSSNGSNISMGSGIGNYDVNIVKFDSNGVAIWGKLYGSTGDDQGSAITLGNNDSLIYIGCKLGGQITYAAKTSTYYGGDDYLVAMLDTSGKVLWYDYGGGSSNDGAQGIFVDKNNFIYVAAFLEASSSIAGQSYTSKGSTDALYVKYYYATSSITLGADKIICSGDSLNIGVTALLGTHYLWNNGDTNAKIMIKPVATTTYILKAFIGCDTTVDTIIINVVTKPTPNFGLIGNTCTSSITFQNNSLNYSTIQWDFGDGNTDTNTGTFNHNFTASGNYAVKLVAISSMCKDSVIKSIKINIDSINVSSFNTSSDSGCKPFKCTFTNTSSGATNYIWDFGDGSPRDTNSNTSHTYLIAGSFTVKLYSIDSIGCKIQDSSKKTLNIYINSKSAFSYSKSGCTTQIDFTNNSTNASTNVWNFGDGNTSTNNSTNLSHVYSSLGTYIVKLNTTSANGCVDSSQQNITISNDTINNASFNLSSKSGCAPVKITYTNKSNGGTNYIWDFGDGSTDTNYNTSHTYLTAGSYNMMLISIDSFGCKFYDTAKTIINIYITPSATFNFNQINCTDSVVFTNNSTNGISFQWDFGDGNTDTNFNIAHNYNKLGTFKVLLTVINGTCQDTELIMVPVKIDSLNKASFYADNYGGCIPLNIKFTNKSIGATNYVWDFDDGSVDTNANTTHIFTQAGTYKVKLIALDPNGCSVSDTFTKTFKVITSITADFTYTLNTCTGLVTFADSSSQANKWEWYLVPDTLFSKLQNPDQKFYADGNYDVKLKAYSGNSCVDSITKTLYLTGINNGLFLPNAFSPNGDGLNDKFEVLGNLKCIEKFHMDIFNRWGERVFDTDSLSNLWDGKTYSGKEAPEGVYIFIFKSKDIDIQGNVKLVR